MNFLLRRFFLCFFFEVNTVNQRNNQPRRFSLDRLDHIKLGWEIYLPMMKTYSPFYSDSIKSHALKCGKGSSCALQIDLRKAAKEAYLVCHELHQWFRLLPQPYLSHREDVKVIGLLPFGQTSAHSHNSFVGIKYSQKGESIRIYWEGISSYIACTLVRRSKRPPRFGC